MHMQINIEKVNEASHKYTKFNRNTCVILQTLKIRLPTYQNPIHSSRSLITKPKETNRPNPASEPVNTR